MKKTLSEEIKAYSKILDEHKLSNGRTKKGIYYPGKYSWRLAVTLENDDECYVKMSGNSYAFTNDELDATYFSDEQIRKVEDKFERDFIGAKLSGSRIKSVMSEHVLNG